MGREGAQKALYLKSHNRPILYQSAQPEHTFAQAWTEG